MAPPDPTPTEEGSAEEDAAEEDVAEEDTAADDAAEDSPAVEVVDEEAHVHAADLEAYHRRYWLPLPVVVVVVVEVVVAVVVDFVVAACSSSRSSGNSSSGSSSCCCICCRSYACLLAFAGDTFNFPPHPRRSKHAVGPESLLSLKFILEGHAGTHLV